jgi:glycosyltransferase involved in cell wall biosynthesis
MKTHKILLMIDRSFLGGGQQNLLALAERLDRPVFEVTVCSEGQGPLVDILREKGIVHRALPFRKGLSCTLFRQVRDYLRHSGFDIVHTHGGVAGLYGRWAARAAGVPVIVHTFHGIHYLHDWNPARRAALIALEKKFSGFTDAVVCVSEYVRRQSLRYGLVPESKLVLIKNAIDFDLQLPPESEEFRLLATRLGLDTAAPLIGSVARLDRVKDLATLVRAAPLIRTELPRARIVVVGGGPEEKRLSHLSHSLDLQNFVVFTGERRDALNWMARMDVFVLPSRHEALPYVLLEAAALEKPVAASDVGGIRELVNDGETGWLFPPHDPKRLAAAVIRMAEDRKMGQRMGKNLRSALCGEYALAHMVRRTRDLYLHLSGGHPPKYHPTPGEPPDNRKSDIPSGNESE